MLSVCGLKAQGSFEFTVPSNSTVMVRVTSSSMPDTRASPAGPCSSLMPNTFSQAMRYSGTSEKANTNEPSDTRAIVRKVLSEAGFTASPPRP